MNWRVVVIDMATVTAIYMLAAFIATQNTPVEDWREWLKAIGTGAGYKIAPEILQYLSLLRAKYGRVPLSAPPASDVVIGSP